MSRQRFSKVLFIHILERFPFNENIFVVNGRLNHRLIVFLFVVFLLLGIRFGVWWFSRRPVPLLPLGF